MDRMKRTGSWKGSRTRRRASEAELIASIQRVVAGYRNAPADLVDYTWLTAPKTWDRLAIPGADRFVEPRHEDRHAGIAFRVGWNESERVAALWIL
jgi:hypothetical protein